MKLPPSEWPSHLLKHVRHKSIGPSAYMSLLACKLVVSCWDSSSTDTSLVGNELGCGSFHDVGVSVHTKNMRRCHLIGIKLLIKHSPCRSPLALLVHHKEGLGDKTHR